MNKLLVFALIVSACYGAIPWAYKNCGTENDNMVITGIVLSAVPEKQVSDNISVIGVSNVHGDIAQVRIDVYLTGVKVTSLNQAFVQTVDPGDMFIFKYSSYIPGIAPSGSYTISFTFLNSKQVSQACSSIDMSL